MTMKIEGNKITADEGKVFRRKESGELFGNEIYLGKSWYIGGVKLDVPHDDVPEDFEEVEDESLRAEYRELENITTE